MCKEIQLTRGLVVVVDDDDFEKLNQFKWYAMIGRNARGVAYAARDVYLGYKNRKIIRDHIYLHKEIVNAPKNMKVDHINHNTLDNRKCNLRICTHQQNICNMNATTNSLGYRGIYRAGKKFAAKIWVDYKGKYIGVYDTKEEAAKAYDHAAKQYFGEFACLNFLEE